MNYCDILRQLSKQGADSADLVIGNGQYQIKDMRL